MMARFIPVLLLAWCAAFGQGWTDRAEYDLVMELRSEVAPAKRLALIEKWKTDYPKSGLREMRAELELNECASQHDWARMAKVAREIVREEPANLVGLYWVTTLAPGLGSTAPEDLAGAGDAAKRLLDRNDAKLAALAHRTLGWVAWQKSDYESAEREFLASLQAGPQQAEISAWLGTVLALQPKPEKQHAAIWHLARAAYLDGDGALPAAKRHEVRSLLDGVYGLYHGSAEGLDAVATLAKASHVPAADFKVESAAEVAIRKQDEELSRTNPDLLTWVRLRRRLEAPDGDAAFTGMMTSALPPLKAFVVRCAPEGKTKSEIVVRMQDGVPEEAVLKTATTFTHCAEAGTPVQFTGTPVSLTRQPFLMTIGVELSSVSGWPGVK